MNFWLHCSLPLLLSFALTRALPQVSLPPKGKIFEGDIIVSKNLEDYAKATKSEKREYHENTFLWNKDGDSVKIPYIIDDLEDTTKKNLELAFQTFYGQTCIEFVPRIGQEDYIKFTKGDGGCKSSIGRQTGLQEIFLGSGCESLATILHEIMHAIGFLHEQSREDRDDYVTVIFENIQPGYEDQFQEFYTDNLGEAYDLKSVMHYRNREFSKNGLSTIQSKSDPNEGLGNSKYLTKTDIKQINKLYNCSARFLQLEDFEITICTSNKWFAGTGATVYLEIKGDGSDRSGEFKAGKGFDEDSCVKIDMFFPHMTQRKLTVRHDNEGWGAAWHVDKIVVKNKTTGVVVTFNCYCWIEDVNAKTLTQ